MAGETTNPIAARSSFEHGCGRRDRGIVAGKNRACCARTSQPRLQHARARVGDNPRVAIEAWQDGHGNPLRHAIRNHSTFSNRRHRARPVSVDLRERIFPNRPLAAIPGSARLQRAGCRILRQRTLLMLTRCVRLKGQTKFVIARTQSPDPRDARAILFSSSRVRRHSLRQYREQCAQCLDQLWQGKHW